MGNNGYSKSMTEIGKVDWIKYHWVDVSTVADDPRQFIRGLERTPDEVEQAKIEWEEWITLTT